MLADLQNYAQYHYTYYLPHRLKLIQKKLLPKRFLEKLHHV